METMKRRPIKIWNPKNKKVWLKPLYMMIYTDREGVQRYFDVAKMIEMVSNMELSYLTSQLNGEDSKTLFNKVNEDR